MNATKLKGFFTAVGSVVSARGRSGPPIVADAAGVVVESLEGRRLLTCSLSGGVLTVTGSSSAETITVFRLVSGNPTVDQTWVRISGVTPDCSFTTSSITSKIIVNALAGNDTIKIEDSDDATLLGGGLSTVGYPVNKITELNGGDGDDSIFGSDQADIIHGNYNTDSSLNGRRGNDTIFGDQGDDTINGGPGNDIMYGGYGDGTDIGNDTISGGDGDDYGDGEGGDDTLFTGLGTDTMYGGAGVDTFWSDDGDGLSDYLDGGAGSDILGSSDIGIDTIVSIEL